MFIKQTGNRGSTPITKKDLSLLQSAQTVSGAHPASYPVGIGGLFTGGMTGLKAHPVLTLRITGAISSLPIRAYGVFCLLAQFS
jgi:hypothetical protein